MKIQKFLLAAAAMVFAVACTETPEEPTKPTPEIQVAVLPTEVSFAADGGENAVNVVAKGAWTATPDADWITVEPASGEAGTVSVKVKATKNDVAEAREGKVVFAVGEEKAEVAVSQQAGVPAGSDKWGLVGDFKTEGTPSWDPKNPIELTWDGNYYSIKNFEFQATATFKFVENGPENDWAVNRGYNGMKPMNKNYYYAVAANGGNIMIPEAGTYDIYLNADASVFYLMEAGVAPAEAQDSETIVVEQFIPEGLFIVGNGTEFGWDANGANEAAWLTKGENGIFTWTGKLLAEGTFKFMWEPGNWEPRYTRDADAENYWTLKYQPAGGTDDQFQVEEDGIYNLTLNVIDLTISCVKVEGGEPETLASIAIRESEMAEAYVAFNVTLGDVVAASYIVLPTADVDDTINAEYVFANGTAFLEEEFNTTTELGYRRGVAAGTEYTIFVAYEDAEGNKVVVTETVTTPGAPVSENYEFVANSYNLFNDTEWKEGYFNFYGTDYEVALVLNTTIAASTDYRFSVDGSVGITTAYLKDGNGDKIEDIEAGSFSIYPAEVSGMYFAYAEMVTASGKTVIAMYQGEIQELGAAGADGVFEVAKAKFYHSSKDTMWDTPAADTRYCLELTSTNNDFILFVIDNYYPLEAFDGETPYLNGWFMAADPEYPTDPCVNLELSFMMNYMFMEFTYLGVESAMPGMDLNNIQAVFKAGSHVDGSIKDFKVGTSAPIAMYTGGGEEGGDDVTVIKKDVTYSLEVADNGWFVYGVWETPTGGPSRQYNLCDVTYMCDVYFDIFDYSQDPATITAVSPGFYPMIDDTAVSGVWVGSQQSIIDGMPYDLAMPEAEADADGRKYGITITVPTSIDAEDCVFEAYLTATDYAGAPVIIDLKYTGPLVAPW